MLGRGGMGVVYKAFDGLMRRDVALKTLRDVASSVFVDLFYRECSVLSAMVHPNIVEIFDMGEFEEDGVLKPYFVMPLLPGRTLHDLIYPGGRPLAVERCTDIISQACRGLHAAHECGLLHRDIKPRNIFVMRDDAVKLIDFGVVRLLGSQTIGAPGTLGTLHYMAPEQITMKPLTSRSDIFSLATVCYEGLTGVHPFLRNNETETAAAVNEHAPPLASALNPLVNRPLALAVAQAMSKDPRNRFESAAAFADALQRGLRNERSGAVLPSNPQNRLARAQRSFVRGDYEFTQEILDQLQGEGIDVPEAQELRAQLEQASRKRDVEVQLATARRYFEEQEYVLALRRVSEVLAVEPGLQAGVDLKNQIEDKLNDLHVVESLALAENHLDQGAFDEGRRLIEEAISLQPGNAEAHRLLAEADKRALSWPQERQQQEELFQTATNAYFEGRLDSSLRTLDQLAELTRKSKAAGARVNEYKEFYKRVRTDHDSLQSTVADARRLLSNGDVDAAFILSERLREQCPQHPDVRSLSKDISEHRESREEEFRRGIVNSIASEPDLSARLHILNQAARSRPNDEYFHAERAKLQSQLQQVTELVQRAQVYESSGRFDYAIEEWLCVGDIYPTYPGLEDHLAKARHAWKESRDKSKTELKESVNQALRTGDQESAAAHLAAAHAEFNGDGDYQQLKTLVESTAAANKEVEALLARIQKAEKDRRFGDIPTLCQVASGVSQNVDPLRTKTFAALVALATRLTPVDWRVAQQVALEAGRIGSVPADLGVNLARQQREGEVTDILGEDRSAQSGLEAYRERMAALLAKYPDETRLEERLRLIDIAIEDKHRQDSARACATELAILSDELGDANDHRRLWDTYIRAKNLAAPFAYDHDVARNLAAIREQGTLFEEAADALTRDRIQECYDLCDSMLSRRPTHVLFRKLRDRAADRHRQLGDEYFARVERWLASEPDVFQRELILQRARQEYPFEARYAAELEALEREKAIAETMAAKARDLEKRGLTAEALAQWRQLRNMHASYPGLEERISACEGVLDRSQRKTRAQGLLSQGMSHLAEGHLAQGYQMVHEAARLTDEVPDQLRSAAPNLVAASRVALPSNPKLAEAMVNLAQRLDESLRLPKDLRAKIGDARRIEDLEECLKVIEGQRDSGDVTGALASANEYLNQYPGVRQMETVRSNLLLEIEQERKHEARSKTLDQFREMELSAANMRPAELFGLRQKVQDLAQLHPGEEEISQRALTLTSLFGALAEVRQQVLARSPSGIEEACSRAFATFPGHPLFKAAMAEAAKQRAEEASHQAADVLSRVDAESDFEKQAALLRQGLAVHPDHPALREQLTAVDRKRSELKRRTDTARGLESKGSIVEAAKHWEAIGKDYPWYATAYTEVERLTGMRRKEKQDAVDRWLRQVEDAIDDGDYDTASTMLRQAAQQQSDQKLRRLNSKLEEALKRKDESDAKFAEGSGLLADGDLIQGGNALYRAFELQPKDQTKANSIALLLLGQIRANLGNDLSVCEALLAHLNRIRPNQILPPDIREALAGKRQVRKGQKESNRKTMEQLAQLAAQVSQADSKRSLSAAARKLEKTQLLDSSDLEVRRTAAELSRKINIRLSGLGTPQAPAAVLPSAPSRALSVGGTIAALSLLLSFAAVVFFLSRPRIAGVSVKVVATPDHTAVELDGRTCVSSECTFVLKPGSYTFKLSKTGYQPKNLPVEVKATDTMPLSLTASLDPSPNTAGSDMAAGRDANLPSSDTPSEARIEIHGARPHTRIHLDGAEIGQVGADGTFYVDIPPGPHTLDLSLAGFADRKFTRNFARGELVSLVNDAVQLKPRQLQEPR